MNNTQLTTTTDHVQQIKCGNDIRVYFQPDAWRTASAIEQQRVGLSIHPQAYDSDGSTGNLAATPSDKHTPSSSAATLPAFDENEDESFMKAMRAHEHIVAQRQLEEGMKTDTDDLSGYIAAIDAACRRASAT